MTQISARLDCVENLIRQRHDRDQTENQRNAATVDSCFELVGSRQHGVAQQKVEHQRESSGLPNARLPRAFGRPLDSHWCSTFSCATRLALVFYFLFCYAHRADESQPAQNSYPRLPHSVDSRFGLYHVAVVLSFLRSPALQKFESLIFWLIRSFTYPAYTCSIFVVRFLAYCLRPNNLRRGIE